MTTDRARVERYQAWAAKMHHCSLHEFLDKLAEGNYSAKHGSFHRNSFDTPERKLEVLNVKDLCNADLVHYLESRETKSHFAHEYCREVEFRIDPNKLSGEREYAAYFHGLAAKLEASPGNK